MKDNGIEYHVRMNETKQTQLSKAIEDFLNEEDISKVSPDIRNVLINLIRFQ